MKILALVTDAFGGKGGIAQYNRDFLLTLNNHPDVKNIRVLVRNGTSKELPSEIEQCPPLRSIYLYVLISFWQSIKNKPDMIFCGHINFIPLAWLISKLTSAPIWLQLHGIDAWKKPNAINAKMLIDVSLVTCVSRCTRRKFLSWSNISQSKVKVLPNTISEHIFSNKTSTFVDNLELDSKKTLLTVGRLSSSERYKGHDRVINCLPELLKNNSDICYLIAGDGDDRDRLEKLAEKNNISRNVLFLGEVNNEDLYQLYATVDLFVMPSTGEGFGIVFLEAMLAGTPVLALDSDGSVDPIQDGNLGTITNEKELSQALHDAINTPAPCDLSVKVKSIFGQQNFEKHIYEILKTNYLQLNI